MSSSSRQEEQLKTRLDETRKIKETIKSLAEKKATIEMLMIQSATLEEYIVKKLAFHQEPNFDAENPYDGPKIDDEKCFKKLSNFLPPDKQVWLVHPKVLRWITVAESKLAGESMDDDVDSSRYSDIPSEFGCEEEKKSEFGCEEEVGSSPPEVVFSKEPTIVEKIVKQKATDEKKSEDLEDTVTRPDLKRLDSERIDIYSKAANYNMKKKKDAHTPEVDERRLPSFFTRDSSVINFRDENPIPVRTGIQHEIQQSEITEIFYKASANQVFKKPPHQPKAGDVYLFYYSDLKDITNRFDGYQWKNAGYQKFPQNKTDRVYYEKSSFDLRQKNMDFKKYEIRWLDTKYCVGLAHYYDNENVATINPRGNTQTQIRPYIRNAPVIKDKILSLLAQDGDRGPKYMYDKLMSIPCAPEQAAVQKPRNLNQMYWVCEQERQLELRLDEAKRNVEAIECLVKKNTGGIESVNLEGYIVQKMGFDQEPDFDCENPYDGPRVDDENCFKNLTSPSSFGKQLCIVHPKVLRWITVAQAKLAETSIVVNDSESDSLRYSNISTECGYDVDVSPSEEPSIVFEKMVAQGELDGLEIDDSENTEINQPIITNLGIETTLISSKAAQKSIDDRMRKELTIRNFTSKIRGQKFDEKDGTTIGQALDYWWAEKTKLRVKEEILYTRRVEIIVKIRNLRDSSSAKSMSNVCEWCSRRKHIYLFAMFAGENVCRTCRECKTRFYRRR